MTESATPVDYNALDDTLPGRITQAGFLAAFYAVPDFVPGRWQRVAAWTGLLAANVATVGALNARDNDPRNDFGYKPESAEPAPSTGTDAETDTENAASPAQTWAALGLVTAGLAGVIALDSWVNRKIAAALRKRGVGKPYALLGVVAGGLYLVGKQVEEVRG